MFLCLFIKICLFFIFVQMNKVFYFIFCKLTANEHAAPPTIFIPNFQANPREEKSLTACDTSMAANDRATTSV